MQPTGLVALADRIGTLRAAHLLLFEHVGGWVAVTDPPSVRPLLAGWAHHQAWHAELWAERFPTIPPVDLERATADGRDRLAALDDDLGRAGTTAERLELVVDGVLPQLDQALDALRRAIDPLLDPSTTRVLDLVQRDLAADRSAGLELDRAGTAGGTRAARRYFDRADRSVPSGG